MINPALQKCLAQAMRQVIEAYHEFLTLEDFLLSLLTEPSVQAVMTAFQIDVSILSDELKAFIAENSPTIARTATQKEVHFTLSVKRVIEQTTEQVEAAGGEEVKGHHILISIFDEPLSQAAYLLEKQGLTQLAVMDFVAHGLLPNGSTLPFSHTNNKEQTSPNNHTNNEDKTSPESPLNHYLHNLNDRVKLALIDPLIGREDELTRIMQILCRRKKNNPLLVGEAGVGKTALAEGLAWRIVHKKSPDYFQNSVIYALDLAALLAGTHYRGEFEKRIQALLQFLEKTPESLLFIDEIHMIMGAGATSESQIDVAKLLKPYLSKGQLRIIGATTYQELTRSMENDPAIMRRFQKVEVVEPSVDETILILQGLKTYYEQHHSVRYTESALCTAAQLADKYLTERYLPDKAIDIIDEAGAYASLANGKADKTIIDKSDIEATLARVAKLPIAQLNREEKTVLSDLAQQLNQHVFGQEQAIHALTDAITISRAGLGSDHKPVGAFLFAGPTGVGKTEITQQLAQILAIKLLRFDMSEYHESHSISRLIGAPPGYVGYEQAGLLTDAVLKSPHAVLLLDEIEKAHPDIFNLLLQVMDSGTLTDHTGRHIDFRHVIIIMTTNAGTSATQRTSIGFCAQERQHDAMIDIERTFSPEFRNRLDDIIWFTPLTASTLSKIVNKFILHLQQQLKEKNVTLTMTEPAKDWLQQKGYDPIMGARPMARTIHRYLKKPIANALLFGALQGGGEVIIDIASTGEELCYHYRPAEA